VDGMEFQRWLSDFGIKFPAVRQWLRDMPDEAQDGLLDSWERALSGLQLDDCLEANQRMLCGELDPPGESAAHWQSIPAKLRRSVMTVVAERWGPGVVSQRDEREQLRNLFVLDREKAGMTREEINRELVAAGFEGIAVNEAQEACHG
jgi:hypothetical protein